MSSEDEVERLAVLAATEEEAEYDNVRVSEDRLRELEQRLDECERDRAARLDNMNELTRLLRQSEEVRAAYEVVVQRQGAQLFSIRHLRGFRSALRITRRTAMFPYQLGRRLYEALIRAER